MTEENEPKADYEKMYNDVKTQLESLNIKVFELNKTVNDKDREITKLQCYIADNIVNTESKAPNQDVPKTFDELYQETLTKMNNKKEV